MYKEHTITCGFTSSKELTDQVDDDLLAIVDDLLVKVALDTDCLGKSND